jgi:hypothetical protein
VWLGGQAHLITGGRPLECASMSEQQPSTIPEFIDAIRAGLVCERCGGYIGSLGTKSYLPPPYPVALDKIPADDEVAALVGFEWYMLGRLRDRNFTLLHPEIDGACVSMREWLAHEHGEDDEEGDE